MDESIEEFGVHFTICKVCTCDWRRLLNRRDKLLVIIRMHRIPSYLKRNFLISFFIEFLYYCLYTSINNYMENVKCNEIVKIIRHNDDKK